jgi:acetate kinase
MGKLLLSINAGSSSVKVSVYSVEINNSPKRLAMTSIDDLTEESPQFTYIRGLEMVATKQELEQPVRSQDDAFRFLLENLLNDENLSEVSKKDDIIYACHRVAHGGDYTESKIIDETTYEYIEGLTDLAPLHNSPSLQIVKTCMDALPGTKNIAYFDTQFHQSMPEYIRTYPINPSIAKRNKLRKYGFHGISFTYITHAVANFLQKEESATSIIALHLGSGASACAIQNGKSLDTSMGLTPVAGLPGATRSGSVDPR